MSLAIADTSSNIELEDHAKLEKKPFTRRENNKRYLLIFFIGLTTVN